MLIAYKLKLQVWYYCSSDVKANRKIIESKLNIDSQLMTIFSQITIMVDEKPWKVHSVDNRKICPSFYWSSKEERKRILNAMSSITCTTQLIVDQISSSGILFYRDT